MFVFFRQNAKIITHLHVLFCFAVPRVVLIVFIRWRQNALKIKLHRLIDKRTGCCENDTETSHVHVSRPTLETNQQFQSWAAYHYKNNYVYIMCYSTVIREQSPRFLRFQIMESTCTRGRRTTVYLYRIWYSKKWIKARAFIT